MQSAWRRFIHIFPTIFTIVLIQALGATSVSAPETNCYALDNSSRLVDFSSLIGKEYEYPGKDKNDLVVRFCKTVERRAQKGYLNFGRFDQLNYFIAGSGHVDFIQRFYGGDLIHCERSYDHLGRTAQVNIACGSCLNGQCQGSLGCVCNVTYYSDCRVLIDLAIPCNKPGPRIFEGFTVGFHPQSWEIVYNGMTRLGFEKPYQDFSFRTEQTSVTLYMTAIASLSTLVNKPIIEVFPAKGLDVKLSGSGATGSTPTTLTPTMLTVDWRCQEARSLPYEVNVTIPIHGYEPVQFFMAKMCDYRQAEEDNSQRGWALFGIISCIFIVSLTLFCIGGFVYKTRVQHLHGVDALPGMTILSPCLEAVSGSGHGYSRVGGLNNGYASEASRTRSSSSAQGSWTRSDRKYGAI